MNYAAMASAIREERGRLLGERIRHLAQIVDSMKSRGNNLKALLLTYSVAIDIVHRSQPQPPPSFNQGGIVSTANQGEHIIPKNIRKPWND